MGWRAYLLDEDNEDENENRIFMFCPPCAEGEGRAPALRRDSTSLSNTERESSRRSISRCRSGFFSSLGGGAAAVALLPQNGPFTEVSLALSFVEGDYGNGPGGAPAPRRVSDV